MELRISRAWTAPIETLAAGAGEDGRWWALSVGGPTIRWWDVETGEVAGATIRHDDPVHQVGMAGGLVVAFSLGRLLRWHAATGEPAGAPVRGGTWDPLGTEFGLLEPGTAITTRRIRLLQRWSLATGEAVGEPWAMEGSGRVTALAVAGEAVATGGEDRVLRIWDARGGGLRLAVPQSGVPRAIHPVRFAAWQVVLCLATVRGNVLFRDLATGERAAPRIDLGWEPGPLGLACPLLSAAVDTPSGPVLATVVLHQPIRIWQPETGAEIATVPPAEWPVEALAAARLPDGSPVIVAGYGDGSVRRFDARTGAPIGDHLFHHPGGTQAAVIVPASAAAPRASPPGDLVAAYRVGSAGEIDSPTPAVGDSAAGISSSVAGVGGSAAGIGSSAAGVGGSAADIGSSPPAVGGSAAGVSSSAVAVGGSAADSPAATGDSAVGAGISAAGFGDSAAGIGSSAAGAGGAVVGGGGPLIVALGGQACRVFDARSGVQVGATWAQWLPRSAAVITRADGGTMLITGGDDAVFRRLLPGGETLPPMPCPGPVWGLAPVRLPDGQVLLAAAGNTQPVHRLDPISGEAGADFETHADSVVAVFDAGGRPLLAGGSPVVFWDPVSGERRGSLPLGWEIDLRSIDIPGRASILVTTGPDDDLRWASVPDGPVRQVRLAKRPEVLAAHTEAGGVPVVYLAFDDEAGRRVERWRLDRGERAGSFRPTLVTVFPDDGRWWAVHAEDGDLVTEAVPTVDP